MVVRRVVAGVLVVGLTVGPTAHALAQSQAQPPQGERTATQPASGQSTPPVDVDELPISVDRIGQGLARPSTITLELSQPMFRAEIIETRPRWLGDIQWLSEQDTALPVPTGPAWHRDFLSMVTPQQARPFGQVQGWDLLQLVASSFAQGVATNMVAGKIKKTMERRRANEARAEVDAAIEAWKKDREKAGAQPPEPAPATTPPR